jgi:hypothetical protein
MSALDTLTVTSRTFYERTKLKQTYALIAAAAGLVLLGFTSIAGGLSTYNKIASDNATGDMIDAYESLESGYGFACFSYILSFILLISLSIYISPLCVGSVI